jgi:hypothetical protein
MEGRIIRRHGWTLVFRCRYARFGRGRKSPTKARASLHGDHRLRNVAAAFKACLGLLALSWASTCFAQAEGTQGAVVAQKAPIPSKPPAILLSTQQTTLASTCGGGAFNVNTFIQVDGFASADVKLTAPGVGLIEEFTDDTGENLPGFKGTFPAFHILGSGGGLPPNTPVTITITTYTRPKLAGSVSWVSSLTFDCTTGVVLAASLPSAIPVPSLSPLALAATASLLLLFGIVALRRIKARR